MSADQNRRITFAVLTYPEAKDAQIEWEQETILSAEVKSAAMAAGFSERDISDAVVGRLVEDYICGMKFRAGSLVLMDPMGLTFIATD